ncbi:MAG: ABC transporter permease [Defluviitaleaceae bacterium]|nr:ABC transporter permease [Defluviitaleaceae bacterium]
MRFLSTFMMGFKYLWKDPVMVLVVIAFPIAIIFILGTALSNIFSTEVIFEPAPVAVVAEADSPLAMFLEYDAIQQFFIPEFTDFAQAEEKVAAGTVSAAFVDQGIGQPVLVLMPSHADHMAQIALTVIDSYQQIGAAATIAIMSGRDIFTLTGLEEVEITSQPLGIRTPGAMDYYAVTMIVMILLFTGLNGMELFHKGLFSETGSRMRLSPISKPALIGGLLAASTVTSFLQGMTTFIFTAVVYGVYWGERIPLVILTLFVMVLFSQALCILLIIIFEKKNVVGGITQTLFFVTTFVSGGYVPFNFGDLERIFRFAPNALAQTVVFGAIYGGDERWMAISLATLFGAAAVMMGLSFILGRRRFA